MLSARGTLRFQQQIYRCSSAEVLTTTRLLSSKVNPDSAPAKSPINFNDSRAAFRTKSFAQLLRARIVYTVCTIPVLVKNAEYLIRTSYKVLGPSATNVLMKYTFFGHFCGGEDARTIKPTVDFLKSNGIGAIFDYAAESDVAEDESKESAKPSSPAKASAMPPVTAYDSKDETKGRVYHYVDEDVCDKHLRTFEDCIRAVHASSEQGFAAIKVTALGNPNLLKRMSVTLREIRQLFMKFDTDGTGVISKDQFIKQYNQYFVAPANFSDTTFATVDKDGNGVVDYFEWSNAIVLENVRELVKFCKNKEGPLSLSVLNDDEMKDLARMRERVDHLAELANKLGVRLMIDAEHSYFQPAIDNIAQQLSAKYNNGAFPIIFNTYQMYLKDARHRMNLDFERAQRTNTHFAAKIVRGAYMVLERAHAKETGQADPILPTLPDTHENYNSAIKSMIGHMADGKKVEIMIASHNQRSIELALTEMQAKNLTPKAKVYFGQLLGMADHLTFHLGGAGYKAYKYVPYGKVNEVMPYLVRRAQENADVLGNARAELTMVGQEILRRMKL